MKGQKFVFKDLFKNIELMCLLVGSIVGVGFITGAEVYESFARFGANSFAGILFLFILFFVLSFKMLKEKMIYQKEQNLLNFETNSLKNTNYVKIYIKKIILFFNVLMISSAMFSGLQVLINQLFFNNQILIYLICVVFVFFILSKGVNGLSKFNLFVVVFLMIVVFVLCLNLSSNMILTQRNFTDDINLKSAGLSILFSTLFVFMNIVEIQPIIDEFNLKLTNKKVIILSFVFALIISLLLGLFCLFLMCNENLIKEPMPLFAFFNTKGVVLKSIYIAGLLFGLLSTLLSCLLGVKKEIFSFFNKNLFSSFIAIMLALVLSFIDFKIFVSCIYPIIGFLSLIMYVFL